MKINVYFGPVDKSKKRKNIVSLAVATGLLGITRGDEKSFDAGQESANHLLRFARDNLRVTNLDEAEIAIYPYSFSPSEKIKGTWFIDKVKRRGIPALFFRMTDKVDSPDPGYGTLYSRSIVEHRRLPNEFALPAFVDDLVEKYRPGENFIRRKSGIPKVSFCGHGGRLRRLLNLKCYYAPLNCQYLDLRRYILTRLRLDRSIHSSFVIRNKFFGTAARKHLDEKAARAVRTEFVDNIFDSDYVLCVRGNGNFSFRFYEALSAGRIPIFVDTHCVLPFEDTIDWKKHCVWIERKDIHRIGTVVRAFHDSLTNQQFSDLQSRNRALWLEYLVSASFYRKVIERSMSPVAECA